MTGGADLGLRTAPLVEAAIDAVPGVPATLPTAPSPVSIDQYGTSPNWVNVQPKSSP